MLNWGVNVYVPLTKCYPFGVYWWLLLIYCFQTVRAFSSSVSQEWSIGYEIVIKVNQPGLKDNSPRK